MGPQHKSCGETDEPEEPADEGDASMGPQHKSCGESPPARKSSQSSRFNGAAA